MCVSEGIQSVQLAHLFHDDEYDGGLGPQPDVIGRPPLQQPSGTLPLDDLGRAMERAVVLVAACEFKPNVRQRAGGQGGGVLAPKTFRATPCGASQEIGRQISDRIAFCKCWKLLDTMWSQWGVRAR